MNSTNWLDLWGTFLKGYSTSSKPKVFCPKCDNIMIEVHAGHLVCESCGSQITEADL
jgi:ribosomal protein S27AE